MFSFVVRIYKKDLFEEPDLHFGVNIRIRKELIIQSKHCEERKKKVEEELFI